MKQTVVMGISSGIAAYKVKDLVKNLWQDSIDVEIIMTHHATQMVTASEFENLLGKSVYKDLFHKGFTYQEILKNKTVDHIALADKAAVFVIAPATANTIAKLAHGIADDVLTTTALAVTAPTVICPSMNVNMWNNPVTRENIAVLKRRGCVIVEPEAGPLACGYEGKGRLAAISTIYNEIKKQLHRNQELTGKRVVVTAGGTVEPIDDVRSLTNKSTGKMGIAIAEACYLRGAHVTLLRAEQSVEPRYSMTTETFSTAISLAEKLSYHVKDADIIFHVAAVSDFTINKRSGKLSSNKSHTLNLEPQRKILDQLKTINPHAIIVAFKAEHGLSETDLIDKAQTRLEESHADAIIANDVSKPDRGFASDTNEVWILKTGKSPFKINLTSKHEVAEQIVNYLIALFLAK